MTTTSAPSALITAEELLLMDRVPGKRYELIRGVLVEKGVATGDTHAATVLRAGSVVLQYTGATDYGEARAGEPGYRLESDPDTVRAPDIAWFAPGRIPPGTTGFPELAPDLCIEVASPSNPRADRLLSDKARMWLDFGAREVWALDPEGSTLTRYRPQTAPVILGEYDTLDGGDLLPGFNVAVWQLFRRQR